MWGRFLGHPSPFFHPAPHPHPFFSIFFLFQLVPLDTDFSLLACIPNSWISFWFLDFYVKNTHKKELIFCFHFSDLNLSEPSTNFHCWNHVFRRDGHKHHQQCLVKKWNSHRNLQVHFKLQQTFHVSILGTCTETNEFLLKVFLNFWCISITRIFFRNIGYFQACFHHCSGTHEYFQELRMYRYFSLQEPFTELL